MTDVAEAGCLGRLGLAADTGRWRSPDRPPIAAESLLVSYPQMIRPLVVAQVASRELSASEIARQ